MPKFDAQAIAEFVAVTEEMLTDVGFTGVKLEPAPLSEAILASFRADPQSDDIPFEDPVFAEEVHYHRITTDQGTFGIWFEPYVTLDIGGLGLDVKAFLPPEAADVAMPEGWCLIGLEEGVPEKLFEELTKKSRQP